jgi:hypothetical protein
VRVPALVEVFNAGRIQAMVSKDGPTRAFDQSGAGPTVILVAGTLGVRSPRIRQRQNLPTDTIQKATVAHSGRPSILK